MMDENLFRGQLVRLVADNPDTMGKAFSRWARDTEYIRLLDTDFPMLWSAKKFQAWFEKDLENPDVYFFTLRTLETDFLIGFLGLFSLQWTHGEAWVGIGLGEREYWGKGYGTDAMRTILGYAFTELNLHRVTLVVFEYNQRAIRSYEKAGFKLEGKQRKAMDRLGRRWDVLQMGVLRPEWLAGGQGQRLDGLMG